LLAEFGRLNGHFQVPSPDDDEINLDNPNDETSIKATQFYKWVNGLHGECETYKNGGESKVLNDERVVQLIKMGVTHVWHIHGKMNVPKPISIIQLIPVLLII
jgi:hypothetical protein